jgi:DNA-binding transcriptional ArsR family regulator
MLNSIDLSGRPLTASPADLRRFVDRKEEFDRTWQSLARRANVLVVGQRGSGKTSFLRKLEATIAASDALGDAVYVAAGAAASIDELLATIYWRLGLGDTERFPGSRKANDARLHSDAPGPLGAIELLHRLRPPTESLFPTTIVLDEPPAELAHLLFGRLRDEVWQLPYTWVVAIDEVDRARVLHAPADAFFGAVVELGELSVRDAVDLLRHRVGDELSIDDLERLASLGGRNPRRLLALAREVVIGGMSIPQLAADAQRRGAILAELSGSAQRVAEYLLDAGPRSASDAELLAHFGWTRNRAVQVLNELEEAGVLTARVEKGGRRKMYELAST